jgi:nicotinate-nucleotide pyrophosphorylase (carboxylating)
MTFTLTGFDLPAFIATTLAEDLGEGWPGGGRDVTSESVIPAEARFIGVMDSRDAITVAGLPIAAPSSAIWTLPPPSRCWCRTATAWRPARR